MADKPSFIAVGCSSPMNWLIEGLRKQGYNVEPVS